MASSLDEDVADDAALEQLGYKAELSRGLTLTCASLLSPRTQPRRRPRDASRAATPAPPRSGSIGITLGCMQPLLSGGVFQLGMLYGGARGEAANVPRPRGRDPAHSFAGPAVVVYGFLGCFLFAVPMVASMVRAGPAAIGPAPHGGGEKRARAREAPPTCALVPPRGIALRRAARATQQPAGAWSTPPSGRDRAAARDARRTAPSATPTPHAVALRRPARLPAASSGATPRACSHLAH